MTPSGTSNAAVVPQPPLAESGLRAVARNAIFLFVAYLLPRLLTFAAVIVAARVLGIEEFGAYSMAAAYAVVLSVVATAGMMPLLIRDLARAPEGAPGLLAAAHRIKTGSNVLMLAALLALGWGVFGYPKPVLAAALLLGVSYAVGAYVENLAAYFQAVERMEVWMQASTAAGVVAGGLGIALVALTSSLVWFCLAPVMGQLAALAWLWARTPPEVRGGRAESAEVWRLLRAVLPYALGSVALALYYKVDVLLLAHWRGAAEVGIYSAAYRFIDILHALVLVVAGAAYPRLSRVSAMVAGTGRWGGTRLTELLLLTAVPTGALLWLVREPLVHLLYGAPYARSASVLALLAMVVPALAINLLAGYLLSSTGRMAKAATFYTAGVLLNVALNAALVPTLGASGAALAMLVSETALAAGFLILLSSDTAAPGLPAAAASALALVLWGAAALLVAPLGTLATGCLYLLAVAVTYERLNVLGEGGHRAIRLGVGRLRSALGSSPGAPLP